MLLSCPIVTNNCVEEGLEEEIMLPISCKLHISAERGALKVTKMGMEESDSLYPEDGQFVTCLNTSYRAPRDTAFSVRRSHLHMKLSPVIMVSSGPE